MPQSRLDQWLKKSPRKAKKRKGNEKVDVFSKNNEKRRSDKTSSSREVNPPKEAKIKISPFFARRTRVKKEKKEEVEIIEIAQKLKYGSPKSPTSAYNKVKQEPRNASPKLSISSSSKIAIEDPIENFSDDEKVASNLYNAEWFPNIMATEIRGKVTRLAKRKEKITSKRCSVTFMALDIYANHNGKMNIIGLTEEGEPIHVVVSGFKRYFYVMVSTDFNYQKFEESIREEIYRNHKREERTGMLSGGLVRLEEKKGYRPLIFHREVADFKFVKIIVLANSNYRLVLNTVRKMMGTYPGLLPDHYHRNNLGRFGDPRWCHLNQSEEYSHPVYATYEAVVTPIDRFRTDCGISGGSWVCVETPLDSKVDIDHRSDRGLPAQIQLNYQLLESPEGGKLEVIKKMDSSPIRVMSLATTFDEEKKQVTSVACVIGWNESNPLPSRRTQERPFAVVFTTDAVVPQFGKKESETNPSSDKGLGLRVLGVKFKTCKEVVEAAVRTLRLADPDVLTGYELASHDLCKMFETKADAQSSSRLQKVREISRVAGVPVKVRRFQTYGGKWVKQGRRMSHISNEESSYLSNLHGRVLLDVKKIVQGGRKLETYSILVSTNAVLGKDSEVSIRLKNASKIGGWGLAVAKAEASFELLRSLKAITDTIELGRATGLSLESVWTRGQLARVWSLLLRECRLRKIVVTDRREGGQNGVRLAVGPLVYDCVNELKTRGLHTDPVIVLDFASMYPSIMIAHNICFSTLVTGDHKESDWYEAPVLNLVEKGIFDWISAQKPTEGLIQSKRYRFSQSRPGVLPEILRHLLKKRKAVKTQLKAAKTESLQTILDARQKALKVCANAVYGFTGTNASKVFVPALAETVLMTGVNQLLTAAIRVGQEKKEKVIYGDTDSLMILCKGQDVKEASKTGERLSKILSDLFPEPCQMKLESIFLPFLLQHNKHYAGAEKGVLTIKGMEAVSRGTLPVLRKLYNEILADILLPKSSGSNRFKVGMKSAIKRILDVGRSILKGKCPMGDLTLTRALWMDDTDNSEATSGGKGKGQYTMSQPHVEVARKKRQRGQKVRKGERISYVLVHTEAGATQQWKMAEDPTYARDNCLPLALRHYVDNMVIGPLLRLFEVPGLLGSRKAATKAFAPLQRVGVKHVLSPGRGLGKFFSRTNMMKKDRVKEKQSTKRKLDVEKGVKTEAVQEDTKKRKKLS
mmetsp:Transcript_9742/g.14615  ORF Transcript_9742/g.14615 Transcript_9742/m.14615 type:complete len:1203 (+) Transcript_9742:30-3638(+)